MFHKLLQCTLKYTQYLICLRKLGFISKYFKDIANLVCKMNLCVLQCTNGVVLYFIRFFVVNY